MDRTDRDAGICRQFTCARDPESASAPLSIESSVGRTGAADEEGAAVELERRQDERKTRTADSPLLLQTLRRL